MTQAMLAGAVCGLGILVLLRALFPPRPGLRSRIARYDDLVKQTASQRGAAPKAVDASAGRASRYRTSLGESVAVFCDRRGWQMRSTRADLALVGREYETYLATKVLAPVIALIFIPLLVAVAAFAGISVNVPLWAGLAFAVLFFFYPDLQLKQEAAKAREDFRHVVGAFLDLVAMNLAGGRGVPEALMSASQIGDSWPMRRIRDTLASARISGMTPWQALGALGDEINIVELGDLAAALTLVADDGAKVRQSLAARAGSMRSREISEIEGRAGQNSQTMLIAQLSFCLGFLIFLIYPSLMQVLNTA
ncbi:type II secretion system F family protein [Actinocorallia longicatena]|uniref:Type II secretion system F family protein n=1 Tax=Actinocorallia longicatena TaxID=111803 RepID=A0ABP6QQY5_9ACTN